MDGIDANPEIKADYEYYANGTALTVPAILYDAVVAGNGDPQTKCREAPSVMYMLSLIHISEPTRPY